MRVSPGEFSQATLSVIRELIGQFRLTKVPAGRRFQPTHTSSRRCTHPSTRRGYADTQIADEDPHRRCLAGVAAVGCLGAERHRRRREGQHRSRDAGRHCRSVQPGAHRESPVGRHRRTRPLQDRRSASGRVRDHVHAARLQHRQARSGRTAHELHRDHQRRPAGGRARRNSDRFRAVAGRGRAERRAADRAHAPGARCGADRAQHPDARRAVVGRATGASRRRRNVRHAEPRPHGARLRRPGHDLPGRRHDAERHRRRRQRAELLQRGDVRGDQLSDQRDQRGSVGRRRPRQHDSERRRQRVQGHAVPVGREPEPAKQQQRRCARKRAGRAGQPQQGVGLQHRRRRADPEGHALVLRLLSRLGRLSVHRQQLLQERRPDHRRCEHQERRPPADDAAGGEEQGVGVPRSHPEVPRPRKLRARRLCHCRRSHRHPRAEAVLHDRSQVDEHGQQQAADRGRARDQQRELHARAAAGIGRRDPAARHDSADRLRGLRRRAVLSRADPPDVRRVCVVRDGLARDQGRHPVRQRLLLPSAARSGGSDSAVSHRRAGAGDHPQHAAGFAAG